MMINLNAKLSALFLIVSLIPAAILVFLSLDITQDYLEREIESHLQTAAESDANHIETVLEGYKKSTLMMASGNCFKDAVDGSKDFPLMKKQVDRRIKSMIASHETVSRIRVLNKEGVVIVSSHEDVGYNLSADKKFMNAKNGVYIGEMHISRLTANQVISISAPILLNGEFSGAIIVNFDAEKELFEITMQRTGLEDSGEMYIINKDGYMITPSKYLNNTFPEQKVDTLNANECLKHIKTVDLEHELEAMSYYNYLGNDVLGVHAHIPETQWCLLAEMDKAKAFEPITQLKMQFLAIFLAMMVLVTMLSFFISRSVSRPLIELKKSAEEITKGDFDNKIQMHSNDEIGALAKSFEQMRIKLKKLKESLEDKVSQKTKELQEKVALLERFKKTVTDTEIHAEQMRVKNEHLRKELEALKSKKLKR